MSRRKRTRRDKRAPIPTRPERGFFIAQTTMSTPLTMSVEEVADTLKIHRNSVTKLIQDGAIPAGKSGRAYIILTRDVLAYAEQIIMKQTAERLMAAGRAQRSPHRRRKVTGAQVRVAH